MPRSKSVIKTSISNKYNRRTKFLSWLGNRLGVQIVKTTPKSVSYIFQPEPIVRKPSFDYVNLFEVACTSWILRRAFGAIIRESTRNGWDIKAKFKYKCPDCEKEYQEKKIDDKCTAEKEDGSECGGELRKPSQKEYKIFKDLIDKPNPDYGFADIVKSTMFYNLALDDWYWGIAYKDTPRFRRDETGKMVTDIQNDEVQMDRVADELYVEDARFIFPVADEYGHLGSTIFFCPDCYDITEGDQPIVTIPLDYAMGNVIIPDEERERLLKCPFCEGEMKQTAYVQEVSSNIVARFTKDEIEHGSTSRVLPELFGNSRMISVWTITQTILAMDGYNFEVYSEGKVGSLLGFPGYDQLEIDKIKKSMENELKRLDQKDITSGRFKTSKKIRTLMMGIKKDSKPERVPLMQPLKDMQSLEFYNVYTRAIDGVYGVTSEFVSGTEGGTVRFKIEVDSRTYKAEQTNFCEVFNDNVLPKWNVHDWKLIFNPSEPRDRYKEAQVHQAISAAAFTYLRGGFNVSIGPEGNLVVSGKGKIPEGQENQGFGARANEAPKPMTGKPNNANNSQAASTVDSQRDEMHEQKIKKAEVIVPSPYGAKHSEKSLSKQLDNLINNIAEGKGSKAAKMKRGEKKAKILIDKAVENLKELSLKRAIRRTGKKDLRLPAEEIKRLERYKVDALDDFNTILADKLKRKKVKKIKKQEVRLPTSWNEVTTIKINGATYNILGDQDEIYVAKNGKEVKGTRLDAREQGKAFSLLITEVLDNVYNGLLETEGFNAESFKNSAKLVIGAFRRGVSDGIAALKNFNNHLDAMNLNDVANELDKFNQNISKLKPSTLEDIP